MKLINCNDVEVRKDSAFYYFLVGTERVYVHSKLVNKHRIQIALGLRSNLHPLSLKYWKSVMYTITASGTVVLLPALVPDDRCLVLCGLHKKVKVNLKTINAILVQSKSPCIKDNFLAYFLEVKHGGTINFTRTTYDNYIESASYKVNKNKLVLSNSQDQTIAEVMYA